MSKVFVNGCFDVLHYGHLKMLEYAKSRGTFLKVAIDSDSRIKETKGPKRPYNSSFHRKYFLECVKFVDEVEVFNSAEELEQIIEKYSPDLMIVGSEYKEKKVIGAENSKKLEFFEKIDGFSTTRILQNTTNR